mmetsp:Transcript_5776/g.13455  ORF Transcript_5776/g.13455 Transcript_5776/m.13455 type:complete len:220 (+) Transcript_5776:188-847(+)
MVNHGETGESRLDGERCKLSRPPPPFFLYGSAQLELELGPAAVRERVLVWPALYPTAPPTPSAVTPPTAQPAGPITATRGGTVTTATPTVTAVPAAMPNLACCHIWIRLAARAPLWNWWDILLRALAFSSISSSFCPRSRSNSMLSAIMPLTSSTCCETSASFPLELACSMRCSMVGANEACAARLPPCRQSGDSRRGSVRKASFSRYPLACSSEKSET